MSHGSIIGYDINSKICQISFLNEETQEPDTLDTGSENHQIPLVMTYNGRNFLYNPERKYFPS